MAKQQAKKTSFDATFKKVNKGARISDAILCVVFFALALNSGWWVWWVSAAFCAFTAAVSPLDKLVRFANERLLKIKTVR